MGVLQINIDLKFRWFEWVGGHSGWAIYCPFIVVRYFCHENQDSVDMLLMKGLETRNLTQEGRVFILPKKGGSQSYVVVNTIEQERLH